LSEIELMDAILRHSLQLQRLAAGDALEAERILKELERELKVLLQSKTLSAADKRAIRSLIVEAETIIDPAYARLAKTVDTQGLAVIVAEKTADVVSKTLAARAFVPSVERIASLARNVLIEGSPLAAWWRGQAENLKRRFAAQVRLGVLAGETNELIVRRIAGGRTEIGLMDIARRHARTLVHSSVMASANDARLAVYRKNADIFSGVRWLATLDSNTCLRCGALDGLGWDLEAKPIGNNSVSFMAPPLHANCRCVLTGIPKRTALEESFPGISAKLDRGRTRASSQGQVPSMSFEDFLRRQPDSFVEKVLGKKRAEMFLAGKLSLRDLISGTGRGLRLDELAGAL
jgi:hypothetical protein